VILTGGTAGFSDLNAGINKAVTASGFSLDGADAANYQLFSSSATTIADINKAQSGITLSTSQNPALPGATVTFTANLAVVAPGAGAPSGAVQFKTNGIAASSPVTIASGAAAFSVSTLPHGTNAISAEYPGDANFVGATNSLSPSEVINTPPTAGLATFSRSPNLTLKIRIATLLTNFASDADGDIPRLVSIGGGTNAATITTNSSFILYAPSASNANSNTTDHFDYVVQDGFWGGTNTGSIAVVLSDLNTGQPSSNILGITNNGSSTLITFAGIPGYTHRIQRTTTLAGGSTAWTDIGSTNIDSSGIATFSDNSPPVEAAYYRTVWP
jgi:hypothetical protein